MAGKAITAVGGIIAVASMVGVLAPDALTGVGNTVSVALQQVFRVTGEATPNQDLTPTSTIPK